VVGGSAGLIGDIVIGVVGAFVGGVLFRAFHSHAPLEGGDPFAILRLSRSGRARRI
jgi:uncharacterized membrane protein YeaQ/YmgE (transglycosylase-associated protein family)